MTWLGPQCPPQDSTGSQAFTSMEATKSGGSAGFGCTALNGNEETPGLGGEVADLLRVLTPHNLRHKVN